jgi:hypothetical protein
MGCDDGDARLKDRRFERGSVTSSFPRFPAHEQRLSEGWTLTLTDADAFATPADMPRGLESIPAPVPGTVAEALEASGQFDRTNPRPLNGFDAWYRLVLISENSGKAVLRFDGLATFAEIYLNGHLIAVSQSMYEAYEVPVDLTGSDELAICFRALAPRLEASGPRARWRPQIAGTSVDPHDDARLYARLVPRNSRRRTMAPHYSGEAIRSGHFRSVRQNRLDREWHRHSQGLIPQRYSSQPCATFVRRATGHNRANQQRFL